jgi:acetyltransferase-like isoleucine patch superfamily enzyme/acyl carrier protein
MLGWLFARAALVGADQVGRSPRVRGRPYVENFGRMQLGDELWLDSSIVQSHLVTGPKGVLEIGARVRIGYGAAIAAHARIDIGDGCQLGPFALLMDTDFHQAGRRDVAPEGRAIFLGRDVHLGSRVTILPGTSIGDGARIEDGSVVSGVISPGAVASGVPARVRGQSESTLMDGSVDLGERLRQVVARVLALGTEPELNDGPATLKAWDSLGTLKLLLATEEGFGISVHEEEMTRVQTVADLVRLVEAARAKQHQAP